jgi:tripartite-type tricarboxylate transporter receptor subunit TctC
MIVGWPPGGTSDILARLVTQSLAERLNQPFIVENRPGAGSNIAADAVVRAPADGYTLLLINAANASNAALYDKLSFNFIRDIVPVAGIYQGPFVVVVHPSVPASTIPELIAYAKANPGKLNMGSPGIGSTVHLAGELFKMMTGVDMVHVPYRGRPIFGLITGEVHVMFATIPGVIEHIRSGALRPLAVTTVMRSESLPGVPTVGDYVLGYEANDWYGVGAPAGTPKSIIEELHRVVNIALAGATLKARIADLGGTPLAVSQSELAQLVAEDTERWAKVVKFSGAKPD